ncbi:Axoneme central apparatus protein [Giardia lamblia P15]|uniref:Axoneme central apparatus protein n=1 Tax=Giardia intestinalis (strain P15) TaxID=658858 RepID=E1EXN2_GIAIA|nr:Axoneme central apparatus protein [Giardia lamblia P15]
MATNRFVVAHFEAYQKARQDFVQGLAELAQHPQNVETIKSLGGVALCRSLLMDNVPSIQHSAATALGRIANFSEEMAELVVANDVLPQLVFSLAERNRHYQKAAAFVLRSVARHSPSLAQAVVDAGSLEPLAICLDEFDPCVKEAAAWALGYIARHNEHLAQAVVDAGAVPFLIAAAQEPELSLKRIAVSALSDISKHTPELAQAVVDAGAISYISPLISSKDARVRRQVCSALSQLAKHSVELAELCVEGEIFPRALLLLRDKDSITSRNAATLVREVVKHTAELAQLVVNAGGIGALVEFISVTRGPDRLPGIMALGFIAAFGETLALSIIVAKGVTPLVSCLVSEVEDHVLAATVWTLGQIGRHSPDHAKAICDANVLPKLLALFISENSSDDLRQKAKRSIKFTVQKTTALPALDPLLFQSPPSILKHVVAQYAKILPKDVESRRQFVTSGGLQKIQSIACEPGTKLYEAIEQCNACFPDEIVKYYTRKPENMLDLIK